MRNRVHGYLRLFNILVRHMQKKFLRPLLKFVVKFFFLVTQVNLVPRAFPKKNGRGAKGGPFSTPPFFFRGKAQRTRLNTSGSNETVRVNL